MTKIILINYLFSMTDINSINFSYLLNIIKYIKIFISSDIFNQVIDLFYVVLSTQKYIIIIIMQILLISITFNYRRYYYDFLEHSSNQIGSVKQDHFLLTIKNVIWSILISSPFPMLYTTIGYILINSCPFSALFAVGKGITKTAPIIFIFMICSKFAYPKGLFIYHFGWKEEQINYIFRYYIWITSIFIFLNMMVIIFDNLNNEKFTETLGRFFFFLLCVFLSFISNNLKKSKLTLYFGKNKSYEDIINHLLWNIIIYSPVLSAFSSCLGYFQIGKMILYKLEISIAIWFLFSIIYHLIRRWILIQCRRIAYERTKQRKHGVSERIDKNSDKFSQNQLNKISKKIDESILYTDTISLQSLQLVGSIITIIMLLIMFLLWSELNIIFKFLDKITLWDVTSSIKGVDNIQPITLGSISIAVLVFIITTNMVRNLPSLLELMLLQHLNLSPGTGYAITTLTKYSLMIIGGIVGFSIVGIEWAKLQWLAAALGVGLGFGLQEIFANFISGLIILFEKPIRIGDTITIRRLTGNITRINTRATTITDWDKKEIIVPNKAFITEQFVNWSLSDTITRVVLNIPAPANSDIYKITDILLQAAKCCNLVLEFPEPEVFLIDLQQGLPLFELRIYAAEMRHRMPIRHQVHALILEKYRINGIELPFPTFYIYHHNQIGKTKVNSTDE